MAQVISIILVISFSWYPTLMYHSVNIYKISTTVSSKL